ncbi:beta-galactosidase [Reichenbachiella ulvae]|uniref:Beta-galactosidase n=1 Tax=Reichenbachiella ulvae TaxID=2980104 RepID=A0ABT3CUG1_9BACT|nr:beta-galactosidase [Reichenbachiella ulvae]MCV9387336.1 beta-galactosidase [Reichenbachiella ulvae]
MRELLLTLCFGLVAVTASMGQSNYSINIDVPEKQIKRGHLDLGGTNPGGDVIDVNSYYITINDKPFFPVVGELHFSRYPEQYWEESIQKMKAGGINVIATYVFWNIHEREEGTFDWSKNLNLRRFAELCEKNDVFLIVRMGPFCHGEMRNGGIPDWMYGRTFEIRSNDPDYLSYVDRLYGEIGKQCKGLLYKDGGPIVGVQLENEFQHSAAPWEITYPGARKELTVANINTNVTHEQISETQGQNPYADMGKDHMARLKQLAKNHGMDVPLYTATGWGNAAIVEKGSIPVTAGYAYPFWAPPSPSTFYLFKDIHKYPDYMPVSYDTDLYPSIPAEIGPGIQVKYSRRPVVDPASVLPLMVRIIGSGSNGIGYYMYHGGSTPVFDGKYYNEEVNGIPKVNYDFQAPIGQYGQVRPHHSSLKTLHMFLDEYAEMLAPMKTVLPEGYEDIKPENTQTLRYAVRSKGQQGFLFMVNFQDDVEIADINDVSVTVESGEETLRFPSTGTFDLKKSTSAIFPFNLKLGETMIKSATVQPLTTLRMEKGNCYVFSSFEGIVPELLLAGNVSLSDLQNANTSQIKSHTLVKGKNEKVFSFSVGKDQFLIIPQAMALNATKVDERLIISDGLILSDGDQLTMVTRSSNAAIYIYPSTTNSPKVVNASISKAKAVFKGASSYELSFEEVKAPVSVKQVTDRKYTITTDGDLGQLNDVFVEIDYVGDRGMAFIDGLLTTDHFYHQKKWEIGMKSYLSDLAGKEMVLIFHPLYDDQETLVDFSELPKFEGGNYLDIRGIEVVNEYKAILTF